MNAEEMIKQIDPNQTLQKEMYEQLNQVVEGKPVMFSILIFLDYFADFTNQITEDDPESRKYIVQLVSDFAAHLKATEKTH